MEVNHSHGKASRPIPACAGIGLRAPHHAEIIEKRPRVGWFEAHSENYFADGGPAIAALTRVRADYPVALHGVGLSLGSVDPVDQAHVRKLARLIDRVEPWVVSEHVCWGAVGGRHTNDLLPLPLTHESLMQLAQNVREAQEMLGRQILLENVSSYLEFAGAEFTEWDFLAALVSESGCGLLLDVNNVYVNAQNHGFDGEVYLSRLPAGAVQEIHLAGHETITEGPQSIRIDTHDRAVSDSVWSLYRRALQRFAEAPTLIEWDANLPTLDVLVGEATKADEIAGARHAAAA